MRSSILIIDDEPAITAALMTRLKAAGHTVRHAINGLAGLEAAAESVPDVIILDVRMPDIDGLEVCIRLRRDPDLHDVPVIFLSAESDPVARRRAALAGGTRFIAKPFVSRDIFDAVNDLTATPMTTAGG
ncbi:MAG: PleD family two-component system response regulator [Phycisphaerales bacterium]